MTVSSLQILRQTAAELLACAVCDIFPDTVLVDSAVSDIGFSYDFVFKDSFDAKFFSLIEERMHALVKKKMPIKTLDMMRQNAAAFLLHHHQPLKAESLSQYRDNVVQVLQMEHFADLCTLPYLKNSSEVSAFKLLSFEIKSEQFKKKGKTTVTRIYGTAFPDQMALKAFLKRKEAAKNKDHKILGTELGLFEFIQDDCVMLTPKGTIIRDSLLDLFHFPSKTEKFSLPPLVPLQTLENPGSTLNCTLNSKSFAVHPNPTPLAAKFLSKWPFNQSSSPIHFETFYPIFQPSNNPQTDILHTQCQYFSLIYSLCPSEKVEWFINSSLQFITKIIKIFGFDHQWALVTHRPTSSAVRKKWEKNTAILETALNNCGFEHILERREQAPYGPKIELKLADAMGRFWSGPFIEIDIANSEKIEGQHHRVLISQSVLGPIEQFLALLIEHSGGELPFWLTPEQVRILVIGEAQSEYADKVRAEIAKKGFRVTCENSRKGLGEKVHDAEKERIPHIVIVGEMESKNGVISVRTKDKKAENKRIALNSFLEQLEEICKYPQETIRQGFD